MPPAYVLFISSILEKLLTFAFILYYPTSFGIANLMEFIQNFKACGYFELSSEQGREKVVGIEG